jgi:release factor glutamine methyltransferase
VAAQRGAVVTATDISTTAIAGLRENAAANKIGLTIIHSDLFDTIPLERFDILAINPPYYKGKPRSEHDHAWYCGEEHEYFSKLFQQLGNYLHSHSLTAMVLSDDCDLMRINDICTGNGYRMERVREKKFWLSTEAIYRISPSS